MNSTNKMYSKIENLHQSKSILNKNHSTLQNVGVLLIVIIIFSCRQEQIKLKPVILISNVVKENQFTDNSGMHALYLKFNDNGSYEFSYDSEGWTWYNKGKYSFKNNSIKLKSNFCTSGERNGQDCPATFHNGKCTVEPTPLNIEFEYSLVCLSNHKFKIFSSDSKPSNIVSFDIKQFPLPAGNERIYEDHKIITMGNITGEAIEPVVLRDGPGINYKKLDYVVNVYDGPYLKSLQKGKKVIIHGRTLNKEKAKNWENYWLLISIDDSNKVWAFGQFFAY